MNSSFWHYSEGSRPDLLCGRPADYPFVRERFTMFMCSIIVVGGFLRMFLKNSEVIILTVLSLLGFVTGQLAYTFVEVHQIIYPLLKTPSFSLYCYFSPLIIFMAALDVDFYILRNMLWQVLLTGFISFSTAFIILGNVIMNFNKDSWNLQASILFSMTISITDPIHSVNSLKIFGISKMYSDIIRGEAMILCALVSIFFEKFRTIFPKTFMLKDIPILTDLFFDIVGSIICGYWCARMLQFILTDLFSNTLTNVILCISMVYLTFYIVQFLGMSGMIALVTVGLNLDSLSFKTRIELVINKFLKMFVYVFQDLVYSFCGIIIGCGETKYFDFHAVVFMVILFVSVNFVRLLTIVLVSPILMQSNYEYNWKWGVVMGWTGMKGVFSLLLAPYIHNLAEEKTESPQMRESPRSTVFFKYLVCACACGEEVKTEAHVSGTTWRPNSQNRTCLLKWSLTFLTVCAKDWHSHLWARSGEGVGVPTKLWLWVLPCSNGKVGQPTSGPFRFSLVQGIGLKPSVPRPVTAAYHFPGFPRSSRR